MPHVDCVDCGDEFWREDDEWWKKRCYNCWLESKGEISRRPSKNELTDLRADNLDLRKQLECLRQIKDDLANLFQYSGFLIFACHPDRVPGKEKVAHEVLVWLNAKREQFRQVR
jgi:hypothetical protein